MSQRQYIDRLDALKQNATFDDFRSLRAKLMWVVHTRPDIACAASFLAQSTMKSFDATKIHLVNRIIRHLKKTADLQLQYPKLDVETLSVVVYVDSSFNNREGNRSQLGFIVLLAYHSGKCSVLHYKIFKSTRVVSSTMAGEALAFISGCDSAFLLRHDTPIMLGTKIPIIILTDSNQVFDVLTRAKYTTEKRLMVDIAAARQAYNERIISNIGLIRSEYNLAGSLTKSDGNKAIINVLQANKLCHPVEQFIIRADPPNFLKTSSALGHQIGGSVSNHA